MKRLTILAALVTLTLTACGGDEAETNTVNAVASTPAPAPATPAKGPEVTPEIKAKQQEVQQTFEQAMAAIPPELREKHQAAYSCIIERNNKLPAAQQKQIGVETIREITQKLQANANAVICG